MLFLKKKKNLSFLLPTTPTGQFPKPHYLQVTWRTVVTASDTMGGCYSATGTETPSQSKQGDLLEYGEWAEFLPLLGWSFISGFESLVVHISWGCHSTGLSGWHSDTVLWSMCDSSLVTKVTSWKNSLKTMSEKSCQWFMAFLSNQMQLKILICKNLGQILTIALSQNCVRVLHAPLSFLWEGKNLFSFLKWLPFLLLAEAELEDCWRNELLGVWYKLSYTISELCHCESQAFSLGS